MWNKRIFAVLVLISCVSAQEFSLGNCPNFPTVKNFDVNRVRNKTFSENNMKV